MFPQSLANGFPIMPYSYLVKPKICICNGFQNIWASPKKYYNCLQSSSSCHPSVLCFHMIGVVFAKCANRTSGTCWPYKCHTNTVWERLTVRPRKWPCLFIFFPTFCRRSFQEWIIALGNSKFKHMLLFYRNIAVWGRWPYLGDM